MARKLKTKVGKIRETYREDWKSKEMRVRQRAVALYFIDKVRKLSKIFDFLKFSISHDDTVSTC